MIGTVKSSLHKALHHKTVTLPELVTVLSEVEAIVNNWPLVYLDDDIKFNEALTPAHILHGRRIFLFPSFEFHDYEFDQVHNIEILHEYNKISTIINHFKRIWSMDYLQSLREKHYSSQDSPNRIPKKGELVIVISDQDKDK